MRKRKWYMIAGGFYYFFVDYYCFFEQFAFKKKLHYAFHVFKAIVYLTFYTKTYKKFFRQFVFVYPEKLFKQLF